MKQYLSDNILFESVQCGIIIIDAETNIVVDINETACNILNIDQSIIGTPCNQMLCLEKDKCQFKKPLDCKINKQEICFMTKLQKRKWLLRTANESSYKGKNYIIESFTDITTQKNIEQNYIELVNYAPAGIYELDLHTYEYLTINQLMLDYTEYDQEEFQKIGIFGLLTDESKQIFIDRMKQLQEGKEIPSEIEYQIKSKSGKIFYVLLNVRYIYNGDKVPEKAFCIVTDITKRKCAEMKLLEEKNRAQMYLDMAFNIFVTLDLNGNIKSINKIGCDILGGECSQIIGLNWFDKFVPIEDQQEAKKEFNETIHGLNGKKEQTWENFIITINGEKKYIRWKNKVIEDSHGNVVGTFSSGDDITDAYKTEKNLLTIWDKTHVDIMRSNPVNSFKKRSKQQILGPLDRAIQLVNHFGGA